MRGGFRLVNKRISRLRCEEGKKSDLAFYISRSVSQPSSHNEVLEITLVLCSSPWYRNGDLFLWNY